MPSVLLKLTISGQQGKQRLNSLSSVETDTRGQMFCKYVNMSPKQVHWLGNAAASSEACRVIYHPEFLKSV